MPAPVRFGFCGQYYVSESPIADGQQTINFYPEVVGSGDGRNNIVLYPTAGLDQFAATPSIGPNRGTFEASGRFFTVIRDTLYEIDSAGVATSRGTLTVSTDPVFFAASQTQLMLVSEGLGYTLNLSTNVFAQISDPGFPAAAIICGYVDGYFIVLAGDNNFYISALNDATSWDALDFGTVESSANTLVTMVISSRVVWIFGNKITQGFFNSGNPDFPFEPLPSATIPEGCAAVASACRLPGTDTVLFLGANESGDGVVYALEGQALERVSDHSVENAIQGYSSISDAVAYGFQMKGHTFYSITFPSGNRTWRYDRVISQQVGRAMWHQALYRNAQTNAFESHRVMYHAFCFGKHLGGDRSSGLVFEMDTPQQSHTGAVTFGDDNGAIIRRVRRCPHVSKDNLQIFASTLEIVMEVGLGFSSGQPASPIVLLSVSRNGGKTYGNERQCGAGALGDWTKRVRFLQLGAARDFVFEISVTDAIPWRLIDGLLYAEVGTS